MSYDAEWQALLDSRVGAWEVKEIQLTEEARRFGKSAPYWYHILGLNHMQGGRSFSWTVPNVDGPEYDLSAVVVPDLPAREEAAR
jgi:hypothetical protein